MTGPLLRRASFRHLSRHPVQFGLAALGIALGVALAVGIDVAAASVRRAFALSSAAATGAATHEIVGGPRGVPDAALRALRTDPALRPRARFLPVVSATAAIADRPGESVQLVGLDPLAAGLGARATSAAGPAGQAAARAIPALVTRPGAALVSATTAARLGIGPGAALPLQIGAERRAVTVVEVVPEPGESERRALDGVVLVDLATAQELLGAVGWLSRIDVAPAGGGAEDAAAQEDAGLDAALAAALARIDPALRLRPVGARAGALLQMTRAFDLNLRALSLLALVVAAFLIYNTMTFAVVQRRPVIGTLRTLGVSRGEILRLVLLEAALLGLLGTGLGLLLGVGASRGLVRLMSRAVTDLYFVVSVREVELAAGPLVRGALLGVLAAIASALPAAREATRAEPRLALARSVLEARTRRQAGRGALLGAAAVAGSALVLAASGRSLPLAFVGLLLFVLGAALVTPAVVAAAAPRLAPALGLVGGLPGRMAARNVAATSSRTGVAAAALMTALSVTVGVSVMVGSFRRAVGSWLGETLRADVYVTAPSLVAARNEGRLPRDLPPRLRAVPGVAALSTNRIVTVEADGGPLLLMALAFDPGQDRGIRLVAGDAARARAAFDVEGAILASEPLANKRGLRVGDAFTLPTARGPRAFRVAGIFRDYGSDAGTVMMARRTFDAHFDDPFVTAIALTAAPGVDVDALVARVRAAARPGEALVVRSNRALRAASLEVFDRTFEVTAVLRLLALFVAAFGVAGAAMAVELERTRELGLLRALGFSPGQLGALLGVETGLLGLLAGLVAAPVGAALAAVLVHVINERSFGWSMALDLAPGALAVAPLLGLCAGLVGGIYPALRMARLTPVAALREE